MDDKRFIYLFKQVLIRHYSLGYCLNALLQVAAAFSHISSEKVKEFWYSEPCKKKILSFLDESDNGKLLVAEISKHVLDIINSPSELSGYDRRIDKYDKVKGNIA